MRDPVERLASQYYFWRERCEAPKDGEVIHQRLLGEQWSLERFCLGPELRNVYTQYLWLFPLRRFGFIGITEHYAADFEYFSERFLGTMPTIHQENLNPDRQSGGYIEDPDLRARIERYHAKDMALYRRALALRAARMGR
jgi:hypothetical protein